MPDYSKGKIYKILNAINDEIYVGSTVETLSVRMAKHRHDIKRRTHLPLYKSMDELSVEHFYIELIENFPCNDIYELRAREGYYIREIGTLNKVVAGRTPKEWEEEHKEEIKEYKKQHRESHKEDYKEYNKQYYENNKEHIKDNVKQYYENNKEHIKLYKKQHYEKNKETYIENNKHYKESNKDYVNEKITCNICSCHVNRSGISRHQKTNKCKLIAESKNKQILR
jgi:hypothetical protein